MKLTSQFILFFLFCLSIRTLEAAEVKVIVNGFKSNEGQAIAYLHNNSDSFPTKPNKASITQISAIKNRIAIFTFNDLANTAYALAIVHDENNNGKLDTNFIGIPKEGVGSSNNAKGRFGPPKFKDAKFTPTDHIRLKITINY